MGRRTQGSDNMRRQGWGRGLRMGVLAAALVLLVAVPVALALPGPTSSTTYVFATTGAQGALGLWKDSSQTVSITATPTVDEIVTVHFNSGNGTGWRTESAVDTLTATFAFPVSAEGSNPIEFYARDTSLATEATQSPGFVNIDKTKPAFTATTGLEATSTQSPAAGWSQDTSGTVTFAATDTVPSPGTATSGVKEISRSINGGSDITSGTASVSFAWAKGSGAVIEGSNAVIYSAKDWAGNLVTGTGYINIDTVPPVTTPTPALAANAITGWRNTPLAVALHWTDVSSGAAADGTKYIVDSGEQHVYATPFTVGTATSNASFSVQYFSADRAGNVETTQTGYVNIDTSIPAVIATKTPSRSSGWYNRNVVVTLTGVDSPSGIDKTQYRLQAQPPRLWADAVNNHFTVRASDNAVETFGYQAVDKAGNVSAAASLVLKMDSIPPKTYGQNASGKVNKSITLKYKITDNLSPKAQTVYVKIKNSKGQVVKNQSFRAVKNVKTWYSFMWKPKAKGTYKYYVYAQDLAGNPQKSAGRATITVK